VKLEGSELKALYANRFGEADLRRDSTWRVLCSDFFQRWVPEDATVLDLAAGHCEFINNIRAGRKIAVDLNPDMSLRAAPGVETYLLQSDDLSAIEDASIDVVFVSNFFEHITREAILATLFEIRRVLRPNGRLLVLQPNIRYCRRNYWMFFDHITPIDDRALVEAFAATGLQLETSIPRFLPYTTKSKLPSTTLLVRLYLRLRIAWRVMGAQAFLVARPGPSYVVE
jgi:ubiquinone/menaquinone biosynthesis C-methylase UbiE